MLDNLRKHLTLWFVSLFVLLYLTGGGITLLVFNSVLTAQLDEDLTELMSEIRPSVEFTNHQPTLEKWAQHAYKQHQLLLATIQLFDKTGKLIEQYGPTGIAHLAQGNLGEDTARGKFCLRSSYKTLLENNTVAGYLQVQVPSKHRDEAIHHFAFTLLVLAPFFALVIWFTGYFFAAKATQPVEQTLDLLRRFVADAGHEFNTPITVIEASIQTLEEQLKENDISTEILAVISRASSRMRDLSANLMYLARMENPESVSRMTPISAKDFIEPVLQEYRSIATQKGIGISCNNMPEMILMGNRESLRTMVSNLLQNAVRYTESGGFITLKLTPAENSLTLTVEDTGIGIPPENMSHIFERFYRVEKSRSRAIGGSGLGLSIVKAIVDIHKGTIKAESQVGNGSKFTVILPVRI